jgi:hypothetical protein
MEIDEKHKTLLLELGLKEEDFDRFDGKNLTYEFDQKKGVRIFDPDYRSSYDEYIGIDGWSAWSTEKDTFMSDILKGAQEKARAAEMRSVAPDGEEIKDALKKKFNPLP